MKKILLALALVAGLTSFAGNAEAAIILSLNNVTSFTDLNYTYSYTMEKIPGYQIQDGSYLTIQDAGNTITSVTTTGGVLGGQNGGGIPYVSPGAWSNVGGNGYFQTPVNYSFSFSFLNFNIETSGGPLTAGSTFAFILRNDTQYTDSTTLPVPEPSTYALFGLGALAMIVAYRRKVA
jgi:hypothetical protein